MFELLKWLCVGAAVGLISSSPVSAEAQKPRGGAAEEIENARMLRLFPLVHIGAAELRSNISELDLPVQVTSTSQNAIIVRGSADDIERVQQLIASLDVARTGAAAAAPAMKTEFLQLRHRPPGDVMQIIEGLLASSTGPMRHTGPDKRLAFDDRNRTLVLRATPAEVAAVKEVLGGLDRAGSTLTLQFFFIRADIGGTKATSETALPKDLQSLMGPLSQSGFANPVLLAPVVVIAEDGEGFQSVSELNTTGADNRSERLRILVKGTTTPFGSADAFQLELGAEVTGDFSLGKEVAGRTLFDLQTTVVTKVGNYTVLAAAPATTSTGNAIALIVRAVRN